MKLTCTRQELRQGLGLVSHALSNRATLPILSTILLQAPERGVTCVTLHATNLELFISVKLTAHVEEAGSVAIPARLLIDLVTALPETDGKADSDLVLEVPDAEQETTAPTLTLTSSLGTARLRCMAVEEWPGAPATEGLPTLVMEAAQLKSMTTQVAFATAKDDSRPILTAVLIRFDGKKLTFAAADAFRLAVQTMDFETDVFQGDLLVPAKNLTEIAKLLPSTGTVQLKLAPAQARIVFETETMVFQARLLEGTFPNIMALLERAEGPTQVSVCTDTFGTMLRATLPYARDNANIVQLTVSPSEETGAADGQQNTSPGRLCCEASAQDVGDSATGMPAAITGPAQCLKLNIRYLADILAVTTAQKIVLGAASANRPVLLHPEGDHAIVHLIMPMSSNR